MKKALLNILNRGGLIRETVLLLDVGGRKVSEAFRRKGRRIYEQAACSAAITMMMPLPRAEIGAALDDLRYLEAFLDYLREPGWVRRTNEDQELAEFAGRVGAQVKILIAAVENYLGKQGTLRIAASRTDGCAADPLAGGGSEA
jgi:hypothetical protein